MVLYIQKYGMQTMNIMKQEKRASLPGGARRFGFVCSFSFEMFWEERMAKYVMALDAGTTSNRCILFDEKGKMCSVAQKEFTQYFPKPGWVEHDASEIWSTQLGVAVEAMSKIGASAEDIAAIGITNQKLLSCGIVIPENRYTGRLSGSAAELQSTVTL